MEHSSLPRNPSGIQPHAFFVGDDDTRRLQRFLARLQHQYAETQAELNARLDIIGDPAREMVRYYQSLSFHERYPTSKLVNMPVRLVRNLEIAQIEAYSIKTWVLQ